MKTCSGCGARKDPSAFYVRTNGKLHSRCKACHRAAAKARNAPKRALTAQRRALKLSWQALYRAHSPRVLLAHLLWILKKRRTALAKAGDKSMWQVYRPRYAAKRKADKKHYDKRCRQATPKWADRARLRLIYATRRRLEEELGIALHIDHIVPLRHPLVCGLHWHKNMRLVRASENLAKSNFHWPDMPDPPSKT